MGAGVDGTSGLVAFRHPRRGKAHQASPSESGSTVCGKWMRDMSEKIEVRFTAPEDRCKKCWPASTTSPGA